MTYRILARGERIPKRPVVELLPYDYMAKDLAEGYILKVTADKAWGYTQANCIRQAMKVRGLKVKIRDHGNVIYVQFERAL